VTRLLRALAGLAGFFLLWEGIVRAGLIRQEFLPPPSVVPPENIAEIIRRHVNEVLPR
jgi:ABC-type nitrate/sulfonate/bicarbonate transport system permease component